MSHKNILITSAGQRVSLVKAFQKEIKKVWKKSKVYTVDLNPILAPACHVSDGYKYVPKVTEDYYVSELITICKEWEVKLVIPTIDSELLMLASNRQRFLDESIIPIVSDIDFVIKCRDKRITNQFFIENHIDIPKQFDKSKPQFPLFIKPYDGSLSKDIFIVENEKDLKPYYFENEKLMFMEYIKPQEYDEYTVDVYYDVNGHLKCAVPRRRIFVRAGEINKGVTLKNEIIHELKNKLNYIKGARGCLTMQFFFSNINKRIIGIEINPRFGGGYPLSYLAGANYPKNIIKEYLLNDSIEYFDKWEENLLMLRYDDEVLVKNYKP